MTDFATDLMWEEEKEPVLPAPARAPDRQQASKEQAAADAIPAESLNERLQRVAGNAALAREAEEAKAAEQRLAEAARRPEQAPDIPARPKAATAAQRRQEEVRAAAEGSPGAQEKAAEQQAAETAVQAEAQRLSEKTKAAAARATALAQVLAGFEKDAGGADLLTLALLVERAPPGIAEETARVLARAVTGADPAQRAAIAAAIRAQLGDRRDLRLARLLADRLVGLAIAPARPAAPPPPPPPPAPPG